VKGRMARVSVAVAAAVRAKSNSIRLKKERPLRAEAGGKERVHRDSFGGF
jgi:hypothetical protein